MNERKEWLGANGSETATHTAHYCTTAILDYHYTTIAHGVSQNSHIESSKQSVVKERSPPLKLRVSIVTEDLASCELRLTCAKWRDPDTEGEGLPAPDTWREAPDTEGESPAPDEGGVHPRQIYY